MSPSTVINNTMRGGVTPMMMEEQFAKDDRRLQATLNPPRRSDTSSVRSKNTNVLLPKNANEYLNKIKDLSNSINNKAKEAGLFKKELDELIKSHKIQNIHNNIRRINA